MTCMPLGPVSLAGLRVNLGFFVTRRVFVELGSTLLLSSSKNDH